RWLARKHRLGMPETLTRFYAARDKGKPKTLGVDKARLARHTSFEARRYDGSPLKPNPYTTQELGIDQELLTERNTRLANEERPGGADVRAVVVERDGCTCCVCKEVVTYSTAQVDHVRPVWTFKRPVDANRPGNLWTLCVPCHKQKTEMDRQRESRVH